MKRVFSIVTIVAFAVNVPLLAASVRDTMRLKEVQVVETGKTNVALLPLATTTISRTEIDKSTETSLLPVLVNKVPGLFVTERGFIGYGVSGDAAGQVNMRGVGQGNKVLFMIDGQPQWAGIFGHSLPDTYVANGVERVEVVRGPSSLLYGSNAMGGSVNIVTRKPAEDGVSGRAHAMWGYYYTQKYGLDVGFKEGKWSGVVAATYDRSNGSRANSDFWLSNQFARLEYAPSSQWAVGANVNMAQSRAENPGAVDQPLIDMWTRIFRGTASFYVKNNYENSRGGIQAYYNWGRHKIDDGYSALGGSPRDYLFRSTDYNWGVTAYQTVKPWKGNDLSLGVDFKQWGGHSWNEMKNGAPDEEIIDRHEDEMAAYLMMQQSFLYDVVSVNAGIRWEHGSQYGNEWIPQAGFILKPFLGNSVKFSFGKGFRSPNLRELYLYAAANPDLKPEYMYNYEVELRQKLMNSKLDMGLTMFFIDGRDMIQTVMVSGRPHNMNTGSFINKGIEFDAAYAIDSRWRADMNYSYLHTSKPILAAPRHKLNGELSYSPGNFSFSLESQSVWGLYTTTGGSATKENYSLLNFRGAYTIKQDFPATLFVKVDNITDKRYEINAGFPMPGITVMGGIDVRF